MRVKCAILPWHTLQAAFDAVATHLDRGRRGPDAHADRRRLRRRSRTQTCRRSPRSKSTPNPNALKFTLREPLTWGVPHSYENAEQAEGDELARGAVRDRARHQRLLRRPLAHRHPGRRAPTGRSWCERSPCRYAPRRARATQSAVAIAAARASFEHLSERDQDRLDEINLLLDEQIRPYLRGDGGDLHVLALEGDRLVVHYQGACGTCPSSISGTLRGIEHLLRTIEPDIEVVAA